MVKTVTLQDSDSLTREELVAKVENMAYRGGSTATSLAVDAAIYEFTTYGNANYEKLFISITDGIPSAGYEICPSYATAFSSRGL